MPLPPWSHATIGLLRRSDFILFLFLCTGCNRAPAPSARLPEPAFKSYRFDDALQSSATVSASPAPSSALMADPVVWQNFLSENDVTWELLRGRMGFRQGDLVVKGDGS